MLLFLKYLNWIIIHGYYVSAWAIPRYWRKGIFIYVSELRSHYKSISLSCYAKLLSPPFKQINKRQRKSDLLQDVIWWSTITCCLVIQRLQDFLDLLKQFLLVSWLSMLLWFPDHQLFANSLLCIILRKVLELCSILRFIKNVCLYLHLNLFIYQIHYMQGGRIHLNKVTRSVLEKLKWLTNYQVCPT